MVVIFQDQKDARTSLTLHVKLEISFVNLVAIRVAVVRYVMDVLNVVENNQHRQILTTNLDTDDSGLCESL